MLLRGLISDLTDFKKAVECPCLGAGCPELFLQYKLTHHVSTFFPNILHKMNKFGLKNAAIAIEKEYGAKVAAALAPAAAPAHHGALPINCAKCGAPVRSDLAHWVDSQTVECEYCASLIRAEKRLVLVGVRA